MSSNATPVLAPPPARVLTPEASNVLGWWWLAIVTTIVLLCSMWPSLFDETAAGGLSATSNYLLVIIIAALLVLGIWCSYNFAKAKPWSARAMRLTAMIGLVVGLVGIGYFLYSVAFAKATPSGHTFFGPSGVLSGIMWGMIIILPFIFGLTLIFGLMNDAVDEWFNPAPAYEATRASLRIDPRTAAAMAGRKGAHGDDELMGDLSEAMSLTDSTAAYHDDHSVEVIGSSEDDLSVEVIGDKKGGGGSSSSMEELAALEEALTQDASKKSKKKDDKKKKKEEKLDVGHGDEPLKVDEDFKL